MYKPLGFSEPESGLVSVTLQTEGFFSDPCPQALLCILSDIAIEEKLPPTKIINGSGSRILSQAISVFT